VTELAALKE